MKAKCSWPQWKIQMFGVHASTHKPGNQRYLWVHHYECGLLRARKGWKSLSTELCASYLSLHLPVVSVLLHVYGVFLDSNLSSFHSFVSRSSNFHYIKKGRLCFDQLLAPHVSLQTEAAALQASVFKPQSYVPCLQLCLIMIDFFLSCFLKL